MLRTIDSSATTLASFGERLRVPLERVGIRTIRDLLLYFPLRHDDYRHRSTIADLKIGEQGIVTGRLIQMGNRRSWQRHLTLTEAILEDDTDCVRLVWFHQPYMTHQFHMGDEVVASGVLRENKYGVAMMAPTLEKVTRDELIHTSGLVAQYPLTKGLTHKQLRYLVRLAFSYLAELTDWIPVGLRLQYGLLDAPTAVKALHAPDDDEQLARAQYRFAFEELFRFQLQAQYVRAQTAVKSAVAIPFDKQWFSGLVGQLPYALTTDQKKTVWTILQDIAKPVPMNRLLNGDVGTGKTLVAGLVMAACAHFGAQAVLVAPTELLAHQHFIRLCESLRSANIPIALYTRTQQLLCDESGEARTVSVATIKQLLKSGKARMVVGTHALFSERVSMPNTALVIVDEQHRFGVDQRRQILTKGSSATAQRIPHHCSMTATPIPRTFALAFFGDFDLSVLTQFPHGRRVVKTVLVEASERARVDQAIARAVKAGEQVFVICSLIKESDRTGRASVLATAERLMNTHPTVRWGVLHGKMEADEQQAMLKKLHQKELDGIVATTVVEVGVDIPEASLLIVEGAEAFGLSQLHQLRGRVGRTGQQAHCVLVMSEGSEDAKERLAALVEFDDGWKIAEADLKLRGPGSLLGTDQSGAVNFRFTNLGNRELLEKVHTAAKQLIAQDPSLESFPRVLERLLS